MKSFSRIFAAIVLIFALLLNAVSCLPIPDIGDKNPPATEQDNNFYIDGSLTEQLEIGESIHLRLVIGEDIVGDPVWSSSNPDCVDVHNGIVLALSEGTAIVTVTLGDHKDRVIITVVEPEEEYIFGSEYDCISIADALAIAEGYTSSATTETYYMVACIDEIGSLSQGEMYISDDSGSIYVYKSSMADGSSMSASDLAIGDMIIISGTLRNYKGTLEIEKGSIIAYYTPGEELPTPPSSGNNPDSGSGSGSGSGSTPDNGGSDVIVPGGDDPVTSDPYVNVNVTEFYANYMPAISYNDAYYRTKHNLMSGSIAEQHQEPTIASYRPTVNGKYVRNNQYLFSEDGNTYYVVNSYGEIVLQVYRGGAYVVLEEVAAYVFAFGTYPANHSTSKNTRPTSSAWGIYLRVNHTKFSGDTSKYPYEPVLPRISGCGGDFVYYEMDIGTTGTDCDPSYDICDYNDGKTITRGAARIVYVAQDINGNKITDLDQRYVFYTYNHYNDFQEYLNYYGGWGEMFGNVTGGGTLSSKYDYNPTSYVEVVRASLGSAVAVVTVYYYVPEEEYVA